MKAEQVSRLFIELSGQSNYKKSSDVGHQPHLFRQNVYWLPEDKLSSQLLVVQPILRGSKLFRSVQ